MICLKQPKSHDKKIYLDANILISYFSTNGEEKEKKKITAACLRYIATLDEVNLFTSYWALSEMTNILVSRHKMKTPVVRRIEEEFANRERMEDVKVILLDASPHTNYSVKEFFYDVRTIVLKHHPGLGDAMHSVIMKNNGINTILTFDQKKDFTTIPGFTVLEPHAFVEGFQKNS